MNLSKRKDVIMHFFQFEITLCYQRTGNYLTIGQLNCLNYFKMFIH